MPDVEQYGQRIARRSLPNSLPQNNSFNTETVVSILVLALLAVDVDNVVH